MNVHLNDWERIAKLREYFKFMMIRNPLERLVSAYRDKIEPPLEFCYHDRRHDPLVYHLKYLENMEYFQAHRRLILSKYHLASYVYVHVYMYGFPDLPSPFPNLLAGCLFPSPPLPSPPFSYLHVASIYKSCSILPCLSPLSL